MTGNHAIDPRKRRFVNQNAVLPMLALVALLSFGGCKGAPKDFEVMPTTSPDPNGFLLNPQWGQQADHRGVPDPYKSCPVEDDSDSRELWTQSPQYPHCTSYPVTFNGGALCGPHVNFEPVTYEGTVFWDGQAFWDDDYDLNVRRDDKFLYSTAGGDQVHIEFDSDETVDNWDDTGTWWNDFHHNGVDHYVEVAPLAWAFDGYTQASNMINGSFVIVIGKLGMDTSHHGKTELHPVYAMFVRLKSSDFRRTSWAFFVRNWGDEGFCSDGDQPLETREHQIKIRIPNVAGLISDNVSEGAQNEDDLSAMHASMQPSGDGVLMTFTLLPPDKQSWFVGDLTFVARPPQNTGAMETESARTSKPDAGAAGEEDDRLPPDLQALQAGVAKLSGGDRRVLNLELQKIASRKKSVPAKIAVLFEPEKAESAQPYAPPAAPPRTRGGSKTPLQSRLNQKKEFVRKFLAERGVK